MTRTVDDDLADPGLARLLAAARQKFQAVGGPGGRITLSDLEPHEALAIDAVWKPNARRRPRRGQDFRCALRDLEDSLVATFDLTLEEVLRRTGEPLRLRPVERADDAECTAAFWEEALAHPLCEREPAVREWVARQRSTGGLGARPFATPRGETLLISLDLGDALPRDPPTERSTFATEMLGDPHALDDGTGAGERLVAQLAARDGLGGIRLSAGQRRALLQRFGVLCDPASATVLTLGLRPVGDAPLERALRALVGTHVVLTLGQLSRMRFRLPPGLLVSLCENPAVVLRAEDRLGADAAPLVCTGGWPGSAVCALLDLLRDAGARFQHHGDFDWDGLAIARWLRDRYGAQPWRFDAAAYDRGLARVQTPVPPLRPPRHRHPPDDPLVVALRRRGAALSEEAVLDDLVSDLSPD